MKTLEQVKDEVAKGNVCDNWDDLMYRGVPSDEVVNEIAKRYAQQVAEDVRARCANNAKIVKTGNSGSWFDGSIDKRVILDTEIVLP